MRFARRAASSSGRPFRRGVVRKPVDRRLADAARRRVDDPAQRDVVLRIVQQVQVREDVLDFLALEELEAVDHLIGDAAFAQGELERPAQGVDAVEDGEIAGAAAAARRCRRRSARRCPSASSLLRRIGDQPHRRALPVVGEKPLFLAADVVGDQFGGHAQDPLRAAVVLLQPHDVNLGKIALELENVVQIRPAPAVDRLIGVAGHGQIRMIDRQRPGDGVLGQIRVLILVDEDEAIALVEARADLRDCRAAAWRRGTAGRRNRRRSIGPVGLGRPDRPPRRLAPGRGPAAACIDPARSGCSSPN